MNVLPPFDIDRDDAKPRTCGDERHGRLERRARVGKTPHMRG